MTLFHCLCPCRLCFKHAEGQVPDVGYLLWILDSSGFFVLVLGFFLSLKSYLHIRLDCDSCRFSNSSGRLPIQKRNNDSDFSDEPMCLCEMFTSPCCLDNTDLCFACLLGGTKRNWFNLEERRFCLDVRKNFLADMGARAQLRTMCH